MNVCLYTRLNRIGLVASCAIWSATKLLCFANVSALSINVNGVDTNNKTCIAYPVILHPLTNPSLVISPSAGACTISSGTRISAFSRLIPMSVRYFIVPSILIESFSSVVTANDSVNNWKRLYSLLTHLDRCRTT